MVKRRTNTTPQEREGGHFDECALYHGIHSQGNDVWQELAAVTGMEDVHTALKETTHGSVLLTVATFLPNCYPSLNLGPWLVNSRRGELSVGDCPLSPTAFIVSFLITFTNGLHVQLIAINCCRLTCLALTALLFRKWGASQISSLASVCGSVLAILFLFDCHYY